MSRSLLWLGVDGWPWAVIVAVKVSTGKTFLKPVEHYVGGYPFWDAVAWAVQAVDTPCLPRQGYEGVLEHVVVRFVAKCSRICTHELVRHRLASYAQTSTRLGGFHATGYAEAIQDYCRGRLPLDELCIIPSGDAGIARERCLSYLRVVCEALEQGRGKHVDDALRYAQPDALAAHILVTTNLREALHIAQLRLHPHAHWEIRGLAEELMDKLWAEHRIPVHLMLVLKRPGLVRNAPRLRGKAEEQLATIKKHLQSEAAGKVEQLYRQAMGCQASRGRPAAPAARTP